MAEPTHRPPLVVFSPLPPMRTGIADYTCDLLPLLQRHYRCTVVVEDGIPGLRAPPGIPVLTMAEYDDAAGRLSTDLHLYHVGNNPDHVYMLPVLARRPGVVVLHDPGLHNLLDCATAALGDIDGYCAAIEAEYGAPGRVLADQFRESELRDRSMLDRMPMLRHLLGPARHVVVHSRYAAHRALSHAPATPVTVAPHQYRPPARPGSGAAWRRRWGIAADEVVFLSLGFVSHIKRIDVALRALARIAGRLPPFRYVVAGELRPEEIDVVALANTLGLAPHLVVTGYVAEAALPDAIAAADVVINLRHPVGGETSGTLIRCLGAGACVVVADEGPFAEIPDGAAVRLPWSATIESDLAACLLALATQPARRHAIGAAAARETARSNDPEATLAAYRAALDDATADRPWRRIALYGYAPPQHRWSLPFFWQRVAAAPFVTSPSAEPALCMASRAETQALRQMGHALMPVSGTAWLDSAQPYGSAFVFLSLLPTSKLLGIADLPARLNRLLAHDGVLVLCLSGVAPGGHVLAARGTGEAALLHAGFRVEIAAAAEPLAMTGAAAPGPDQLVWRAMKISDFIARDAAA